MLPTPKILLQLKPSPGVRASGKDVVLPCVAAVSWMLASEDIERERKKGGERTLYIEIISDRLSPAPPPSLASAALSQNPNLALRVLYLTE